MTYSAYIIDDNDPIALAAPVVYAATDFGRIALLLLGAVVIVAALGYAALRGIDKLRMW